MNLGFSPLLKHLLGHPMVLFGRLFVNGIGIITFFLWCGVACTLKYLWPLIS